MHLENCAIEVRKTNAGLCLELPRHIFWIANFAGAQLWATCEALPWDSKYRQSRPRVPTKGRPLLHTRAQGSGDF